MKTNLLMPVMASVCCAVVVLMVGCESGGSGGDTKTSVVPSPGSWAGSGISFNVSADSSDVTDFKCTYGGHHSGTTSYDYTSTTSIKSSIPISDSSFGFTGSTLKINGTFTDPNTGTVTVEWDMPSSFGGTDSGSKTYAVSH
jgi:hypothetical protein